MQVHCAQIQWKFSENGLLSVSDFLKMVTYFQFHFLGKTLSRQHKLDAVELCLRSSLGLEIQDQETASRRIKLYSLESLRHSLALELP